MGRDGLAQIVRRNPAVGQADGNSGKQLAGEGIVIPGESGPSEAQSYGIQLSRAQEAGELAHADPEGAMRLAQSIADPSLRTVALAHIARAVPPSLSPRAGENQKTLPPAAPCIQ